MRHLWTSKEFLWTKSLSWGLLWQLVFGYMCRVERCHGYQRWVWETNIWCWTMVNPIVSWQNVLVAVFLIDNCAEMVLLWEDNETRIATVCDIAGILPKKSREGKTTGQNSSVYKAASQRSEEVFGSGPWNKVQPCSKLWISWLACTRTRTEFPTL